MLNTKKGDDRNMREKRKKREHEEEGEIPRTHTNFVIPTQVFLPMSKEQVTLDSAKETKEKTTYDKSLKADSGMAEYSSHMKDIVNSAQNNKI